MSILFVWSKIHAFMWSKNKICKTYQTISQIKNKISKKKKTVNTFNQFTNEWKSLVNIFNDVHTDFCESSFYLWINFCTLLGEIYLCICRCENILRGFRNLFLVFAKVVLHLQITHWHTAHQSADRNNTDMNLSPYSVHGSYVC